MEENIRHYAFSISLCSLLCCYDVSFASELSPVVCNNSEKMLIFAHSLLIIHFLACWLLYKLSNDNIHK